MKRVLLFTLLIACTSRYSRGQETDARDTVYRVVLDNHDVNSTRLWANDTVQYRYNQKKYYVKTILTYLDEAVALFNELHTTLNDPGLDGKERREYIRRKEKIVRSRFEERIKTLNETQGVLLVKLTARQTGYNIYQQLSDFKGAVPAMKWQAWARMHGFNLNRKYHPAEEPDLEHIMRSLGYPLPHFYEQEEAGF